MHLGGISRVTRHHLQGLYSFGLDQGRGEAIRDVVSAGMAFACFLSRLRLGSLCEYIWTRSSDPVAFS